MIDTMDEITELRRQMAAMKQSLDNYTIVNKQLIRNVMSKRPQGLNWLVTTELITVPFLCVFFFGICIALHISIWIAITLTIACVIDTYLDTKTMRVPQKLISSLPLQELRKYLVRQKRNRKIQFLVMAPLCAAWILWFLLSYLHNDVIFHELRASEGFLWAEIAFVGGTLIICGIVITVIYLKSQRVNDAMINDIDSLDESPESPE